MCEFITLFIQANFYHMDLLIPGKMKNTVKCRYDVFNLKLYCSLRHLKYQKDFYKNKKKTLAKNHSKSVCPMFSKTRFKVKLIKKRSAHCILLHPKKLSFQNPSLLSNE